MSAKQRIRKKEILYHYGSGLQRGNAGIGENMQQLTAR